METRGIKRMVIAIVQVTLIHTMGKILSNQINGYLERRREKKA